MSAVKNRVSVIIVTHNSLPLLDGCLSCVRAATHNLDHEIVVVDNHSHDSSLSCVRNCFPDAKIVTNRSNLGFAAACNQGAALATGEFLLFLNPDVEVDEDGIRNLSAVFAERDRIGWATARLRNPDGTFQPSCRRFPSIRNLLFSRGSFLSRLAGRRRQADHRTYTLPDYSQTTIVDAVAGAMAMIRRDVFGQIGWFDERFFMYLEDTDLSLRLAKAGYANVFVPEAGGVHHWRMGSSSRRVTRNWHHHRSVWKFFCKHSENPSEKALLPVLLAFNFALTMLLPRSDKGGSL